MKIEIKHKTEASILIVKFYDTNKNLNIIKNGLLLIMKDNFITKEEKEEG